MFDVVVLGLGGMGSAAAAHLAMRGKRVLGIEQFTPAHDRGSSHGQTRIIRKAYFENPAYVPLLERAYELWLALERATGYALYLQTGGLMVGGENSVLVTGSRASALEHGLKHEMLSARELRRRYPATRPRENEVALYEDPAGILFPEACIRAYLERAAGAGAELRFETQVSSWRTEGDHVLVETSARDRIESQWLVVCAGSWLGPLVAELELPLHVERNVAHWFEPASHPDLFTPDRLPVYILDRDGPFMLYGFPSVGESGIKAAFHHSQQFAAPEAVDRSVASDEVEQVRAVLAQWLPDGNGRHLASSVCMYTLTPDEHFLVGFHPRRSGVVIAGGFSGHGFKFCSVMGEVLADLVCQGATKHPIGLFDLERFAAKTK